MSEYRPEEIEARWQRAWEEQEAFRTDIHDRSKPKYYVLDMFPYPSGAGLHVGHPHGYTATDIVARYKRARGFNVLHPMGWDAFGLPAERAAVRENVHPATLTQRNVDNFRGQIKRLGYSYDWSREFSTTDPSYYRWTQWIFLRLMERGLAYQKEVPVNWCPAQGTVLANEEVQDGVYVETGEPVERRLMRQWLLRIPQYAQRLLDDLDGLDWPEAIKEMQRHWIGRSEGVHLRFPLATGEGGLEVFTTRPDTLFGVTYMVVAPEHPLLADERGLVPATHRALVDAYRERTLQKNTLQRTDLNKEKSGIATGIEVVHPITGERLPVWAGDFVLMDYGTGAVMAVPAHDQRDWEFAQAQGLPLKEVVKGGNLREAAHEGDGILTGSSFLDGLDVGAAKARMIEHIESTGLGRRQITYRLRDWLFSRQRYWGEPFPLLLDEQGEAVPVAEELLPVELPHLEDFRPTAEGEPPLTRAEAWVTVQDPATGRTLQRETNTMPQWAGSCWYYLRFIDPHNVAAPVDPALASHWLPVDLYVGGAEHAVLHLLYARFWHKVLYDIGLVSTVEPFQRLYNQGMILAHSYKDERGRYYSPEACELHTKGNAPGWRVRETGQAVTQQIEKMSKSKLNVVNPDEIVQEFGADALRLYEMYMGPLDATKPWQTDGVRGMARFLARAWRLFVGELADAKIDRAGTPGGAELKLAHRAVERVAEAIETMRFNTAIAALIEWLNALYGEERVSPWTASRFARTLMPFAPHLAEEIWASQGGEGLVSHAAWPEVDAAYLRDDEVEIAVQLGGKTRATIRLAADATADEASKLALAESRIERALEGMEIVRTVYVPGRILNLIVRPRR